MFIPRIIFSQLMGNYIFLIIVGCLVFKLDVWISGFWLIKLVFTIRVTCQWLFHQNLSWVYLFKVVCFCCSSRVVDLIRHIASVQWDFLCNLVRIWGVLREMFCNKLIFEDGIGRLDWTAWLEHYLSFSLLFPRIVAFLNGFLSHISH